MSVVFHGIDKVIAAVDTKLAAMSAATRTATATAIHTIEAATKDKLALASHTAGTPTPSAPGDPPALVTGTLRRPIQVTGPEDLGGGRWLAQVGPTTIYGRIQELGGETRGRTLPPRPYLEPAFVESLPAVKTIFQAAFVKAIRA